MKAHGKSRRNDVLILIGCFRLLKAVVLFAAALGALRLLHPGTAAMLQRWSSEFSFVAEHEFVRTSLSRVMRLPEKRIEELAIALFAYASLFTAEGIGLLMEKVWAEYLTIVATVSFIPFEIYEVMKGATPFKIAVLVANIAIVIYLVALRVRAARSR